MDRSEWDDCRENATISEISWWIIRFRHRYGFFEGGFQQVHTRSKCSRQRETTECNPAEQKLQSIIMVQDISNFRYQRCIFEEQSEYTWGLPRIAFKRFWASGWIVALGAEFDDRNPFRAPMPCTAGSSIYHWLWLETRSATHCNSSELIVMDWSQTIETNQWMHSCQFRIDYLIYKTVDRDLRIKNYRWECPKLIPKWDWSANLIQSGDTFSGPKLATEPYSANFVTPWLCSVDIPR